MRCVYCAYWEREGGGALIGSCSHYEDKTLAWYGCPNHIPVKEPHGIHPS